MVIIIIIKGLGIKGFGRQGCRHTRTNPVHPWASGCSRKPEAADVHEPVQCIHVRKPRAPTHTPTPILHPPPLMPAAPTPLLAPCAAYALPLLLLPCSSHSAALCAPHPNAAAPPLQTSKAGACTSPRPPPSACCRRSPHCATIATLSWTTSVLGRRGRLA